MTFGETAREQAREQRVCCDNKNNREQVAADDDGDGFERRLHLHVGHESYNARRVQARTGVCSRQPGTVDHSATMRSIG